MYRSQQRRCPRCEIPMREISLMPKADALVDRCDRCTGLFFDFQDGEPTALARASTPTTEQIEGVGPLPFDAGPLPCPACMIPMHGSMYLSGPPVFRCGECAGTYVTKNQLPELRRFVIHQDGSSPFARFWAALMDLLG